MADDLKSDRLRSRLAALADKSGAATGDERFAA